MDHPHHLGSARSHLGDRAEHIDGYNAIADSIRGHAERMGDPYYPIPRPENQLLFKRYEALADATEGVTFVGRLATYRYYNMDQIVGQALATFRRMDELPALIAKLEQERVQG